MNLHQQVGPAEKFTLCKTQMHLLEMLRYKRPHKSVTEAEFIGKYILNPLKGMSHVKSISRDGAENIHVHVEGKAKAYVLFSSHTDTVHSTSGNQVVLTDSKGMAYIDSRGAKGKAAFGECLGADCATGVWLMMNMIANKVPGYYVFHRGEEVGGVGSSYLAENFKKHIPVDIKLAIAFDRKGYSDIITHQGGVRCASDASAAQLQKALNKHGFTYEPCDGGSFTDTANYKYLVSECFNLSVGYHKQHGPNETQDMIFAKRLLKALCKIDWDKLVPFRDHNAAAKFEADRRRNMVSSIVQYTDAPEEISSPDDVMDEFSTEASAAQLEEFVMKFPKAAARFLASLGTTEIDILETMEEESQEVKFYASLVREIYSRVNEPVINIQ